MHDGESQCAAMSHVTLNCIMKQLNTGCLQQGATYCILYKILKTERLWADVKRYDYLHFKLEVVAAEVDVATTNSYSINTIGRLVVVGLVVL